MHPRAPVIALDGDQAGQQAAGRLALARIAQRGREAAIVTWPRGEDPAVLARRARPGRPDRRDPPRLPRGG